MKRKTLSLLLITAFIASLLGTALPAQPAAAAEPGNMQWELQGLPPGTTRISTGPIMTGGGAVFLATQAVAGGPVTLWKAPTPGGAWVALFTFTLIPVPPPSTNPGPFLTVPPTTPSGQTIYLFDRGLGGPIHRSTDAGVSWTTLPPLPGATAQTNAVAFESGSTGYAADGSGNIFKTTDNANTWALLPRPAVGAIAQMAALSPGYIVVGGSGKIGYSSDGGGSFAIINGNDGESYRVALDGSFASNNTVYLGGSTTSPVVSGKTYRLKIGTDPAPVDLLAPNSGSPVISLACRSGVLYSFHANLADRTLNPLGNPGGPDTPNRVRWHTMDTPPLSAMVNGHVSTLGDNNIAFMRTGGGVPPQLWAYKDSLAIVKPMLTAPSNGTTVDPSVPLTLAWNGMGNGTGQVTVYRFQIQETAPDWSGAFNADVAPTNPASPSVVIGPTGLLFPLLPGKTYQWRVRATNELSGDAIDSKWSDPFTFNTSAPPLPPPTPPGLAAMNIGSNSVTLTWLDISSDETGFRLERASDPGFSINRAWFDLPANVTSYVDTGVLPSSTYFYHISAFNGAGMSPPSPAIAVTTAPPAVPGDMQWALQGNPPGATRLSTGPVLTSDGKLFLATLGDPPGPVMLWRAPIPGGAWEPLFAFPLLPGSPGPFLSVLGSPAGPTIYLIDRAPGGAIVRSGDGGATWNMRIAPMPGFAVAAVAFQDANTGYVADLTGNVYKTTDGAQTWTLLAVGIGPVTQMIAQLASGVSWLIIGGNGQIAYSNTGGVAFTIVPGNPGETYRVAFDSSFASNSVVYLGDASGTTGKTYRLKIGTDVAPVDLLAPNTGSPVIGLFSRSGVLYSFHPNLADRTLNPLGNPGGPDTPNRVAWQTMDTPILSGMVAGTVQTMGNNNIAFMRTGGGGSVPQLWAYKDSLAIVQPVLTSPPSGTAVEPGQTLTLTWNGMGSGTGQVTVYRLQITEPAIGWSGAFNADVSPANPASPSVVIGPAGLPFQLLPGKTYQWRVRARNEVSGDAIDSRPSEPFTLVVNKLNAVVTLGNLSQTYDGAPKPVTVSTIPPGLSVAVTYDGLPTAPANAGSYAIVAKVNDPAYQGTASGTLVIAKADQTINFGPLADKTYGDPDFAVSATASSGLPVSFTASGACTISGNTVHITGLGSCTITASQGGNGNYNTAPPVSQSFTVNITYDRLRYLVDEYVTKKGIVNSLSAKLDAAEAAQARGDLEAKVGIIGAFINEVEAQTSKSISQEDAAILIALAQAL